MKPDGLVESIRQRLLNLARRNGEVFDFVLARYGIERFLYRLSVSGQADRYILKGAMLFHLWNRKMHRPTRDLDLLGSGPDDLESIHRSILGILQTEVQDDGLKFDDASLGVENIREDATFGGVRAKFRAYLGNVRIPVQVDIGFGDAVVPGPEFREFPALLPEMPPPSLSVYPVCTVIAEKFEALVRLDAQNTRMKDFFDLEFLLGTAAPDEERLSNAIHATFKRRGTELPDRIPTGLSENFARNKQVMWNAFLRKNGLDHEAADLSDVLAGIRKSLEWVWKI